ncbi:zinc finger CCCH-type with G patch domain-containing protein-like [Centruroides sculpturatus]|uniref:zinc finger CCCH-type with G patch domain-containing protein-like n=1 Tax=Centruroides sculpturatus TaxID=218467 RepID=UPI000C6CD4E2|nr:zinc finger CCCH-type with G patch domain-containing protein-like [Centruroides sculpturatus]XP_023243059.1 zinc finger CCCH-type with G patch domain-containing protein-like [Centruroides sculpturatus]
MDTNANDLASIEVYQQQLQLVESALSSCQDDEQRDDLLTLKSNLIEVIRLSKESLGLNEENCSEKQDVNSENPCQIDIEYMKFQSEMAELCGDTEGPDEAQINEDEKLDEELTETISKLEGGKCRAPFSQTWGEKDYHNAIILSVEAENLELPEELVVKVLFCNPICDAMKPCSYFLDGRCKFSDDKCRYSHGHVVKLSELQEFVDPDFTTLERDSLCLAKYSNDLWCKARIESCLEDHKYLVKYLQYNDTQTVNVEDILPCFDTLIEDSEFQDSDDDFCKSLESGNQPEDFVNWRPSDPTARQFGEWEKHTNGFGSRMMARMGYVWGRGLGKNGEGRTEPIEAEVLPKGKSLDKCMELRETSKSKDCFSIIKRMQKIQKKREKAIIKRYKETVPKGSVFDFLNKKIGVPKNDVKTLNKGQEIMKSSDKNLNVQSLKINEDIKRAEKELIHLQQAFNRNKERKDRVMQQQLERRIEAQKNTILNLKEEERNLYKEQKSRKDHNKLTIF